MILSLMDRYQEAQDCFKESQKYQSYAEPYVTVRLFINNAYPYIYRNHFDEVSRLLDQARDLVEQVSEPLRTRFILNIDYNYAAVFYWREEFAAAREAFSSVMERANAFGWQWLANGAQNYLGDIATQEGDYDKAERMLEAGLRIAERNNEKRRTARYKRSLANLRHKQGKVDEALTWAHNALEDFSRLNRLGIGLEIQRIQELIHVLRKDTID